MNVIYRLNKVLDYIENNLNKELSINDIAKIAYLSSFQLQSMFSVLANISIGEYIRRRRLTQAAFDLQTNMKVIDVAFNYGYTSPDAFTRAFTKLHGVTPSKVKKNNTPLKSYSRISFQISVKGDVEMNYKIVKKEAFKMYGVERIISTIDEGNYVTIPKFWNDIMNDGTYTKLQESANVASPKEGIDRVNAVMCYKTSAENTFPYLIGCFITDECESYGYEVVDIGEYTWGVFRTENHPIEKTVEKIQALWVRIYSEWLPSSGYEIVEGPNLELYGNTKDLTYSEVWLPIKKL